MTLLAAVAESGWSAGMIGGIAGSAIGILGGLIGTYCSVKNTRSDRERSFMIRAALIFWLLVGLFLIGMFCLPSPYNSLLWIPYAFALTTAINKLNRRQQQIREEESPDGNAADENAVDGSSNASDQGIEHQT